MADKEKAILDFLYFQAGYTTKEELLSVRLNLQELQKSLNWDLIMEYAAVYNNRTLDQRLRTLHKILAHADAF